MAAVVGLSLLAAFCFAAASALQQRAASSEGEHGRPVALLGKLIRRRMWILGWLTNVVGFCCQTEALRLGGVAIVQPLLTMQLLFAVPLATVKTPTGPSRRDWAGAVAVCAGLAIFLESRGSDMLSHGAADRGRFLLTVPFAVAIVFGLGAIGIWHARRPGPQRVARPLRAATLGVGAGICFAYTSALIIFTSADLFGRSVAATAIDWPGYSLAASTLCGILLEQQAFALGTLAPALATMTITNPLVAYALGVVAFGGRPPDTAGSWAALFGSAAAFCFGVWLLTTSPTARRFVKASGGEDGDRPGDPADHLEQREELTVRTERGEQPG